MTFSIFSWYIVIYNNTMQPAHPFEQIERPNDETNGKESQKI